MPLLLIVGICSLIEEYLFLRPKWIAEYILKVSSLGDIKPISRDKIVEFRVERMKGGIANAIRKITIKLSDSDKIKQIIFKKYRFLGSIYCFIGFFLGPFPPSKILPGDRQKSEQIALEHIANIGIPAPKVLFMDTNQKITIFQFIEGERLDKIISEYRETGRIKDILSIFYNYGLLLAAIHQSGGSLIDANPFNLIYKELESKIYFVDLELSSLSNNQDWDLAYSLNAIERIGEGSSLNGVEKYFLDGYTHSADRSMNENVNRHRANLQKYNRLHRFSQKIVFK